MRLQSEQRPPERTITTDTAVTIHIRRAIDSETARGLDFEISTLATRPGHRQNKLDVVRIRIASLTKRERQVFCLSFAEAPTSTSLRALGGTERTIRAHRQRVMEEMQVQSLAELASAAECAGTITPSRPTSIAYPKWNQAGAIVLAAGLSADTISCMRVQNDVLVVDDDPGMFKAIQRLLRQHDYEAILFSSAEAFKKHAHMEKAVCVILDINLNDGSGIELRYHLEAGGHSVPVIYMTASESPAVREAALASGCIAFLTKPFSVQELIEPLKKASAGRS